MLDRTTNDELVWAEYIWPDKKGKLRSKTKMIKKLENPRATMSETLAHISDWSFDGSSTLQAKGHFSDCLLKPVYVTYDPIRGGDNVLVLCEVFKPNGKPHETNTRHVLRKAMEKYEAQVPLCGIEQEYTLYGSNGRPFKWPEIGLPEQQGKYYCGMGYDEVQGRPLKEEHMEMCKSIGLSIEGTNAEVMLSQWEFQIGLLDPLEASDQLMIARYLLYVLGEKHGAYAKLDPKPQDGDWNGAGGHVNFSTFAMRKKGGNKVIREACNKLSRKQKEHIAVYGVGNEKRLTGLHETCGIDQFRFGVSNRGASIRIPIGVALSKKGYLEDRRPAANLDPYKVLTALLDTTCGKGFNPAVYDWEPDVKIGEYKILKEESVIKF